VDGLVDRWKSGPSGPRKDEFKIRALALVALEPAPRGRNLRTLMSERRRREIIEPSAPALGKQI